MNNELFNTLINEGYEPQQIMQISKIEENINSEKFNNLLADVFNPNLSVDTLRNLNKIINNQNYSIPVFLNLVAHNCDISEYINGNIYSLDHSNFIAKMLLEGYDKEIIKITKRHNLPIKVLNSILYELKHGGKPVYLEDKYIKDDDNENMLIKRFKLIKFALLKQLDDAIDVIMELNESGLNKLETGLLKSRQESIELFNTFQTILLGKSLNLDMANLIDKYDIAVINAALSWETDGFNVVKFLRNTSNEAEVEIIGDLLYSGHNDEEINYFLNTYPMIKNSPDYEWYVYLYHEGYKEFLNYIDDGYTSRETYYLVRLINEVNDEEVVEKLKKMKPQKRLKNETSKLSLMCTCLDVNRKDLIKTIFNTSYYGVDEWEYIEQIIRQDKENGTHHKIINLLYEKAADVFGEYNSEYEFDSAQKIALSKYIAEGKIDDTNIECIRDKQIPGENMDFICYMMSEKMNVDLIVKNATNFNIDDIRSIERCMKLGFKLDDKDVSFNK